MGAVGLGEKERAMWALGDYTPRGLLCMPNITFMGINYLPWKYGAQYGHGQTVSSSSCKCHIVP